jgi:uncharacterized protein
MKRLLIALACLVLTIPCLAQNADEPASRDDVTLLLRTMHSHDLLQKLMAAQSSSMRQLLHDQLMKENGSVPADFETRFMKMTDELTKSMPIDDIMQAMIPAYQKHFTHGDIEAMNAFYASPVGQKVVEELPAVTQEGMRAAMPILSQYLSQWQERMKHELEPAQKSSPAKTGDAPSSQN